LALIIPTRRAVGGWLASLAHEQGKHAKAKVLYEQALRVFEKQLGTDHPHTHALRERYKELLRDM